MGAKGESPGESESRRNETRQPGDDETEVPGEETEEPVSAEAGAREEAGMQPSGDVQVTVVFPPDKQAAEETVRKAEEEDGIRLSLVPEAPVAPATPAASGPTASDLRSAIGPVVGSLDQVERGVEDLTKRFSGTADHLVELRHLFSSRIAKNESQEKAFNKLYEEMSRYRDNFLLTAEKPLFMSLILLYDSIVRTEKGLADEEARKPIANLRAELLEALYRHDVELISERPNRLDISFQKAIRREETDDPNEDMRVVEVVRDGFRAHGKVIRPQEVVVKRRLAPQ